MTLILLATFLAGCNDRPDEELPLEAGSLEGTIDIGDDFTLEEARLTVAAETAPARAGRLDSPPGTGATALARDHWVLEAFVQERAPGSVVANHTARLMWNGADAGSIAVSTGEITSQPRGARLLFDVGADLPRSNVYAFELTRVP